MVSLSKRNKRTSLHQKYKVEKKIRQHHKKVKKELKTSNKSRKSLPLSMQMPMEMPDKTRFIKEVEESEEKMKLAEAKRLKALAILKKQPKEDEVKKMRLQLLSDSSRSFIGDIRKLVDESDVIVMVLDARDPMGTRSIGTERMIRESGKTLVFALNKIDLVPFENMKRWLAFLGREARVFPFKANRQEQAQRLGMAKKGSMPCSNSGSSSGAAFGVSQLLNHLRSLRAANGNVDSMVVGVAGVPNTGKSSLINSLKRKHICVAGERAGLTRVLQRVAIDNHIVLMDSPGIVLARAADPSEFALRNCVRVEKIEDPVTVAEAIFNRCSGAQLRLLYNLPVFDTVTEFMLEFATRLCPLRKGGRPDLTLASRRLIDDWNRGKIAYCTEPPASDSAATVSLTAEEESEITTFSLKGDTVAVLPESKALESVMDAEGEEDDEQEEEEEESDDEDVDMDE